MNERDLARLTAQIAANYVAANRLEPAALPEFILSVKTALAAPARLSEAPQQSSARSMPTRAQIKRSIRPNALVSFLDGKEYRTLKRHLGTHGMTPAEYREAFGLAKDYPMVASDYSAQRSALAKASGLGVGGRKSRSDGSHRR